MRKIKAIALALLAGLCCAFGFLKKDRPYVFPSINYFPPMPVAAANPVTVNGAALGRYLFYDPILSADSTLACASCHKQQHAFSDAPNRFSKGFGGQVQHRNTLPLFNLAWYTKLFWDGRADALETQVFHPVRTSSEMNMNWPMVAQRLQRSPFYRSRFKALYGDRTIDSSLVALVIAQFERTLISYRAKYDQVLAKRARFTMDELEGLEIMNDMTRASCLHCHTTDANGLGTTGDFSNNGLDSAADAASFSDGGLGLSTHNNSDFGKFKIPSLRNLAFTAPYMHDGRFKTLEEVLDFYSSGIKISPTLDNKMEFAHQGGSKLSPAEKRKILLFLQTLNDSAFVMDKEFSNPFQP